MSNESRFNGSTSVPRQNYSAPNGSQNNNGGFEPTFSNWNSQRGGHEYDLADVFTEWFFPETAANASFERDMFKQDYQNWFNSPAQQMQRMIDAGINPNLAAAGISGAGNSPAVSPGQSAVGAGAAGVGAAAQVGQAAAANLGAAGQVADNFLTLRYRNELNHNEAVKALMDSGKTELESKMLALSFQFMPVEKFLQVASMQQNLKNMSQEYNVMTAQTSQIYKQIEQIDADIALAHAQRDYTDELKLQAAKQSLLIEAQTTQTNFYNNQLQKYGSSAQNPFMSALLFTALENPEAGNKMLDAFYNYSYKSQKGFNAAEIEDGFEKAFNQIKADKELTAEYAPYMAYIEENKAAIIEFFKAFYENPNDMRGLLAKLGNIISHVGTGAAIDSSSDIVPKPQKPTNWHN